MKSLKKVVEDYKLLLDNVPALVTVAFCVGTVWMNISAAKILFNAWNVAITGGFLVSWLPFLCLDVTAKRFGARAAIMLNILSAVCNVICVIGFSIVAAVPTTDDYTAFNTVLGGVWFISLSSIIAFVVSGVINSIVNGAIGKLFSNRTSAIEFASRSFISTFIGQALDNFLFIFLTYSVFAPIFWGTQPLPVLTCIGTSVLGGVFELIAEVIISPLGYRTVKRWERDHVGQAYIDAHTSEKAA